MKTAYEMEYSEKHGVSRDERMTVPSKESISYLKNYWNSIKCLPERREEAEKVHLLLKYLEPEDEPESFSCFECTTDEPCYMCQRATIDLLKDRLAKSEKSFEFMQNKAIQNARERNALQREIDSLRVEIAKLVEMFSGLRATLEK